MSWETSDNRNPIPKYAPNDYEQEITQSMAERTPQELTELRKSTHGDWRVQSTISDEMKKLMHRHMGGNLTSSHREALDMIAVKISRIIAGNPNEPDHWDDIAGYAHLGKGGHK